jgi:hypothetical protein
VENSKKAVSIVGLTALTGRVVFAKSQNKRVVRRIGDFTLPCFSKAEGCVVKSLIKKGCNPDWRLDPALVKSPTQITTLK